MTAKLEVEEKKSFLFTDKLKVEIEKIITNEKNYQKVNTKFNNLSGTKIQYCCFIRNLV